MGPITRTCKLALALALGGIASTANARVEFANGSVALATASRKLDKAVSKGVIHRNQAANKKSALAKQVGSL